MAKIKTTTIEVKDNRDTGSIKLGKITRDLNPGDTLEVNGVEVTVTSTDLGSKFPERWLTFCARQRFSFPRGDLTVIVRQHVAKKEAA